MESDIQGWSVTVEVNGENVLSIGSVGVEQYVSGVRDLERYADVVRSAAIHLRSFIGPAEDECE